MARGKYDINGVAKVTKDTSWLSMIGVVVIFAIICWTSAGVLFYHNHHFEDYQHHRSRASSRMIRNSEETRERVDNETINDFSVTNYRTNEMELTNKEETTIWTADFSSRYIDTTTDVSEMYLSTTSISIDEINSKIRDANFQHFNCSPKDIIGNDGLCDTAECENKVIDILTSMNATENICEFHRYACGNIGPNNFEQVTRSDQVWKRIEKKLNEDPENDKPEAYRSFNTFYSSCLNHRTNFEILKSMLKKVEKFKTLEKADHSYQPSISQTIAELLKRNFPVFFDLRPDFMDNNEELRLVLIPSTIEDLVTALDLGKVANAQDGKELLANATTKALEAMGIPNFADFEMTLDRWNRIVTFNSYVRDFEIVTVEELHEDENMSHIGWKHVLDDVTSKKYNNSTKIKVYNKQYLRDVLLKVTNSTSECRNFLLAMYATRLYLKYSENDDSAAWKRNCRNVVKSLMNDLSSHLYLGSFESREIHRVNNLTAKKFVGLRDKFKLESKQGGWLRTACDNKIDEIELSMSETDGRWSDANILNAKYQNVTLAEDNFAENAETLEILLRKSMYSYLRTNGNESDFLWTYITAPTSTELKSIPELNMIAVPFAAIYSEASSEDLPEYLLMADLGFALAQEFLRFCTDTKEEDRSDDEEGDDKNHLESRIAYEAAHLAFIEYNRGSNRARYCSQLTDIKLYFIYLSQKLCADRRNSNVVPERIEYVVSKLDDLKSAFNWDSTCP